MGLIKLPHQYFLLIITLGACILVFIINFGLVLDGISLKNCWSIPENTSSPAFTSLTLAINKLKFEDELMDSEECSQEFGFEMINRWKTARIDVCNGFKQSHIICYVREYHSAPRILCVAQNSEIRLYPPHYIVTQSEHASPSTHDKVLNVDCDLNLYQLISDDWWNRTESVANFMTNIQISKELECSTIINHTVFWMNRYDFKNLYHIMEDVVTTYESLLVLDEDPANVELVIYDGFPINNAIFGLWGKIFGRGVRILRDRPYENKTCFKKSVFNMIGAYSHLSNHDYASRPVHCTSPILKSMRWWLKSLFGISEDKMKDEISSKRIIFLSRHNYGNRTIARVIPNEDELINDIRSRLKNSSAFANWSIEIFRPELINTVQEQFEYLANASILIGVHGAGITNIMFLPPSSHLIEIFHSDRSNVNWHYRNICKWLNISYHSPGYFVNEVPSQRIWPMLEDVMREIESS